MQSLAKESIQTQRLEVPVLDWIDRFILKLYEEAVALAIMPILYRCHQRRNATTNSDTFVILNRIADCEFSLTLARFS